MTPTRRKTTPKSTRTSFAQPLHPAAPPIDLDNPRHDYRQGGSHCDHALTQALQQAGFDPEPGYRHSMDVANSNRHAYASPGYAVAMLRYLDGAPPQRQTFENLIGVSGPQQLCRDFLTAEGYSGYVDRLDNTPVPYRRYMELLTAATRQAALWADVTGPDGQIVARAPLPEGHQRDW